MTLAAVRTTVVVGLSPSEAFGVFTTDMPIWYRRGAASLGRPDREAFLRLEPYVGGRVLRVGAEGADGTETAIGRVTAWEPAQRVCFVDQRDTEVEVWFEPEGASSTRVVLEHRGLDGMADDVAGGLAQYGWRRLPLWFEDYVKETRS